MVVNSKIKEHTANKTMYLKGACGQSHAIVCIFEVDLVTIDENVTVRAHMPFFFLEKTVDRIPGNFL